METAVIAQEAEKLQLDQLIYDNFAVKARNHFSFIGEGRFT